MTIKYMEEYRDLEISRNITKRIMSVSRKPARLMEVCGTHTMSLFRNGIRTMLPASISLLSGPGCPDVNFQIIQAKEAYALDIPVFIRLNNDGFSLSGIHDRPRARFRFLNYKIPPARVDVNIF